MINIILSSWRQYCTIYIYIGIRYTLLIFKPYCILITFAAKNRNLNKQQSYIFKIDRDQPSANSWYMLIIVLYTYLRVSRVTVTKLRPTCAKVVV